MTPMQLAGFRAHAALPVYRRRLADLRHMVAGIDPATTYVSFSAGKDSAVLAHACQQAHPDIPILMIDPGCPTHWLESERQRWRDYAAAHGWRLTLFPWDKWAGAQEGESEKAYQARIHASMFAPIAEHARAHGLTCRAMGLRADESRGRRMSIAVRGMSYAYKDGTRAILPLARWSEMDIWAYLVAHEVPWLDIYDIIGPHARNGLIGRSGENFGRVAYLRQYFPDVWRWAVARGILEAS
jgi:3'-phosphoadenosine 5'-phosphosulfate sulfotransferase (PAPS reductase)/FAD synthetase